MGVDVAGLNARLGADPQAALDDASAIVAGYLRAPLETVTEAVTLIPDCSQQLWLPFRRVQSVQSVQIGTTPLVAGTWALQGDSLWRYSGWRTYASGIYTPATVTVTVTHGFTVLPDDIAAVIYALAVTSTQNPEGLRQFSITQGSKSEGGSYATETIGAGVLSAEQKSVLNKYRNRRATSVRLVQADC